MSSYIVEEIEKLKDRLWITKKSRMESEARMRKNATISNVLVSYYTFFVLGFSIWALILDANSTSSTYVNVGAVIASVGLFGISLLISTFNYVEKAAQYKHSYISLDELEHRINHFSRCLSNIPDKDKLNDLYAHEKEYNNIIARTENHQDIDYIKMLIDKNHIKVTNQMKSKYLRHKIYKKTSLLSVFLIPIVIVIVVGILLYK